MATAGLVGKKVSELRKIIKNDKTEVQSLDLSKVKLDIKGAKDKKFRIDLDGNVVNLTDQSIDQLAKVFGLPGKFFTTKITDGDLTARILNHVMTHNDVEKLTFEHDGEKLQYVAPYSVHNVHRNRYLEGIVASAPAESIIRSYDNFRGRVVVDVSTPNINVEARVGDITEGGARFTGYLSPLDSSPTVQTRLHRLWCSNGSTNTEEGSLIRVRGRSVDEVLESWAQEAERVFTEYAPQRLHQFASLVESPVANPEQYVTRRLREAGLIRFIPEAIKQVAALTPEQHNLYDIQNLLTALQHSNGITGRQNDAIQALGGTIIEEDSHDLCGSCARPL